jgi:hypothetical protein
MVSNPNTPEANERASEPTRAARGSRGPYERACRGVRGAKPLSVILVSPLAIALAVLAAACSGIKAQTNSFATLDEARQAGAIADGRMPQGLPPASHDIREGHVPGTSQRWGLFEFPNAEEPSLRGLLQREEISVDGQRCEVPARIEWWPLMLRGQLDGGRLATTGIRIYRAREGNLLFAVNWGQGRAYYWSPVTD